MQKNVFLFQCIKGTWVRNSTDYKSTYLPSVFVPHGESRIVSQGRRSTVAGRWWFASRRLLLQVIRQSGALEEIRRDEN